MEELEKALLRAYKDNKSSLGNNEFDDGSKLSPFLNNLDSPILASNIIIHNDDYKQKIQKSIIINVDSIPVGLVGYLAPEYNILDGSTDIEYIEETIALQEEITKLQAQDVKIIIALGHSEMTKAIEIATQVEGIDLVIVGHKNIYHWNGTNAEIKEPQNDGHVSAYQKSGKSVPVIQSYAYNNFLGKVNIKFDANGEITDYQITPIRLDVSIPQDPETSQMINRLKTDVSSLGSTVLGSTAVLLDGESCAVEECNFGNLVADSVMYYYAVRHEGERWTDAPIAIIHGGAIEASISPSNRPASVTMNNLLNALPTESTLVTVTMNGTILLQMLEHSVGNYRRRNPSGQFLQFSGIRVVYDLAKESGSRIVSAMVRCWDCSIPQFFTIDGWRTYKILMPVALSNGQFGYSMLVGLPKEHLVYDEVTCTLEFIRIRSPVYPEVSGRIILLNTAFKIHASALSVILSIASMFLLHNI